MQTGLHSMLLHFCLGSAKRLGKESILRKFRAGERFNGMVGLGPSIWICYIRLALVECSIALRVSIPIYVGSVLISAIYQLRMLAIPR